MSIYRLCPRSSTRVRTCLIAALIAIAPALHAQVISVGTIPVGSTTSQTTQITITTAGQFGSAVGLTQGAPALDFTATASLPHSSSPCSANAFYTVGQTCNVQINFSPRAPGLRLGAVQLLDSTGTIVLGTTLLTGTGIGPAAVFPGNSATEVLGLGDARGSSSIFGSPTGIAVDGAGNIYVADADNDAVEEILAVGGVTSPNSTVVTIGSNFSGPLGLAVDGAGNVYVADYNNNAVKEILAVASTTSTNSTVITISSNVTPTGVAVDGAGNLYVAVSDLGIVEEILAVGGATSSNSTVVQIGSNFLVPFGVAVDAAGNVYVADLYAESVYKVLAVNGVTSSTSTVVPVGRSFIAPDNVAVDATGNVYVTEFGDSAVKEILAGDGVASYNSQVISLGNGFSEPYGLAIDGAGNVFVADTFNAAVEEIPLATPQSLAFAPTGVNTTSPDSPQTVQVQNIGNAPLAISNFTASTNFAIDHAATTCSPSISLPSDVFCNLGVDFAPEVGGPLTGTLTFTDNSAKPAQIADLSGTATSPAVMVSPAPGSVLTGSAATFTWTSGNGNVNWQIDIGSQLGGHQYNPAQPQYNTSYNATGLPTNGSTIYVRLYSRINNAWQYNDYTYTAYEPTPVPAAMISPAPGTTLNGSSATFTWSTGTDALDWQIDIGSQVGGHQYNQAQPQYNTSYNATGLPTDGSTIYVRLYSRINNAWQYNDYTYTAYEPTPVPAAMISPAPGSVLTGSSATFTWTTGTDAVNWQIDIGSQLGGHQYNQAQPQYNTSYSATGLPTNGSTIHVRLYSRINNAWQYNDYTYTAYSAAPVN